MIGAISQGVSALAGIAGGIIGGGARRREEAEAKRQMQKDMTAYRNLDISNPFAAATNQFEDLTVNQQQAQFEAQQQQQGLANTLSAMQGAAGGSGIAALAQAMAGQQSANLQQASASIGQQEAANQMAMAKGAQQAQTMRLQGEAMSRQMEADKTGALLDMSTQRLRDAKAARQQATQSIVGGLGQLGGAVGMAAADDWEFKTGSNATTMQGENDDEN